MGVYAIVSGLAGGGTGAGVGASGIGSNIPRPGQQIILRPEALLLPGRGKLVKAERKERMGRNPATGEQIKIAAKTTVKFRIAKAANDAIAPPKA